MAAYQFVLFDCALSTADANALSIRGEGIVNDSLVTIRELIGWDLDEYSYRDFDFDPQKDRLREAISQARLALKMRKGYTPSNALMMQETNHIKSLLDFPLGRTDLQTEYEGLDWSLGVVDLSCLLAFQRRLVFDPELRQSQTPLQHDWASLLSFALGPAKTTSYTLISHATTGQYQEFTLHSPNPDLRLQSIDEGQPDSRFPFTLHGGSPFLEVAELRGRWFLRDGYHRAYRLLKKGVSHIPAVVIRARSIEEVGAVEPWFFNEQQLFSAHPPRVTDFLEDDLVLCYERPRLIKMLNIQIKEMLVPNERKRQGDNV